MSMRQTRFTMINNHQVEFASDDLLHQQRHNRREAVPQKAQINSMRSPGTEKGVKIPIKHKLT